MLSWMMLLVYLSCQILATTDLGLVALYTCYEALNGLFRLDALYEFV